MTDTRPLLVVRHVAWEGPHRILDAFTDVPIQTVDVLVDDTPLPAPGDLRGAVIMGGPMSVNDTGDHPRLAEEIAWLETALDVGLPILGICLGSQLIARALGARVFPGPVKEIGFEPIEILDESDLLVGSLAPSARVLHWHGEVFDLPAGATPLARSAKTRHQGFRSGNAWGLLFHPEADRGLVEAWLAEPTMAAEARAALGPAYASDLRDGAPGEPEPGALALFTAFAARCADFVQETAP